MGGRKNYPFNMDERAKRLSEEQFIKIYDALADDIFRHLYFRVYDYERAKELTQESFIRVWKYLANGKKIDNLKALAYKIATNLAIDESRKKKAVSLDAIMEAGAEIDIVSDNNTVIKAEAAIVLEKMQKLNEYERNLVLMRYINQMTTKEIAEILGKSENAISIGLNRAVKKLTAMLSSRARAKPEPRDLTPKQTDEISPLRSK